MPKDPQRLDRHSGTGNRGEPKKGECSLAAPSAPRADAAAPLVPGTKRSTQSIPFIALFVWRA